MSQLPDVREAILARLVAILTTVMGGPVHVFRNRLRIADDRLPAAAILDGDETPDDSAYGRGRPANTPIVCIMRPEIYVFAEETGGPTPVDVGTKLNDYRKQILKAVLNDSTLLGLVKDKDIRFEGFSTGLGQGRSLEGEMAIGFAFVYTLRPGSL